MASLNFYPKHLIPKKNLSSSTGVPLCTVGVIVHRFFVIVFIHKIELLTKKKVAKKKGNNSNTAYRNMLKTNLKVGVIHRSYN